VNILVAAPDNAAPDGYVMPDLTGLPVTAAMGQLTRIGLKVDPPTYIDVNVSPVGPAGTTPVPPIAPGSVITQQPLAGARVDQNTIIKLVAAK
jgi:eukaryotic-like serine/threonine-protein kinase